MTWELLRIHSFFHANLAGPADDSHPPQREALRSLFAVRSQRPSDALVPIIAAAAGTLFLLFLLFVLGSLFRTFSETLYQRSRPLVFVASSTPPPRPADDEGVGRPVLQAVLLLLSILFVAWLVGVQF